MISHPYGFAALKKQRLTEATRPFNARGKLLKRCEHCQLALYVCACDLRVELNSQLDFVLLLHRNEILKPTNTGRIIADILPENTFCFCWSRTEPAAELLNLLADPNRQCVILYPEQSTKSRVVHTDFSFESNQKTTVIVLDGTWKQARRMMTLSPWLANIPVLSLELDLNGQYGLRKPLIDGQLATAEAAACVLAQHDEMQVAQAVSDTFAVFTQHYLASRQTQQPKITEAHHRLSALKKLKGV